MLRASAQFRAFIRDAQRGRRARALLLFVALASSLLFSWLGSAHAQATGSTLSGESASKRTDAKRRFDRGLVLAKAGQWDAALAEFVASREMHPTRAATRNAAIALRQLKRIVEALEYYELLTTQFATSIPSEELAIVRSEMAGLRVLVGELDIRTDQPGTTVVIDGKQRGVTPFAKALRLDVGTHTIRLSKDGFESVETSASVAGEQRKTLSHSLRRLRASGTLVVREASGAKLDVVLDAAVVGKTPWIGNIAPGPHSIVLRGANNLGTAPSSADVKLDQTTTLTLRAVRLEGTLVVDPSPSSAAVYVNGVGVGNGIWEGNLPTGTHRIEIAATGHLPFRREVVLSTQEREVIRTTLDRDLTSPLWKDAFRPRPYAELTAGLLLASSFRAGAENCNCTARSRPFGGLAGARLGYTLLEGLGVEVAGGYLGVSTKLTREIQAFDQRDTASFVSTDYEDVISLKGPFAALSLSYRLLRKTPLTARASVGFAQLTSTTSNRGTFSYLGEAQGPATTSYQSLVSIDEVGRKLATPFTSTELRLGYRFSKHITADLGVALLLLLPASDQLRAGNNSFSDEGTRSVPLEERQGVDPGVLTLPRETIAGPFLAVSPSLGVRVEL